MKHVTATLRTSLESEVRTLAACLKIEANDKFYTYTSHQENLYFEGKVYNALPGFTCGTISSKLLSGDNSLTLDFVLTEEVEALFTRLQDFPRRLKVTYFYLDYEKPDAGAISMRTGHLGHLNMTKGQISLEMLSLTDRLNQEIGELYSPDCRANLGDKRCQVDIMPLMIAGEVESIDGTLKVSFESDLGNGSYKSLQWINGENQGLTSEIKKIEKESGILTLFLPPFARIAVGDKFKLVPGCDKTLRCCRENYGNTINFRGEPFIPEA